MVNENIDQLILTVPMFPVFVIILMLNRNGKTQLANFLAMLCVMLCAAFMIYISEKQTEVPFLFILIAFGAIHLIRHQVLKHAILVISLILYISTDYYNSKYLEFDDTRFYLVSLFVLLYYLALNNWDNLNRKYQRKIESQNQELAEKNEKIKQQTSELMELQNMAHETELKNRQRDMDTVLANQAAQIRLIQNVIDKLAEIVKSKEPINDVRSLMIDLKSQADTQSKLNLLNKNLEEVNAVLYERLLAVHPDLTKSERELCAFIRIGLSSKEIAALKSINVNSVNTMKTRLRKKLSLEENAAIGSYLVQF